MKAWKDKNVQKLKDVLHKNSLLPKTTLQEKMDSHLVWLHYFQIGATLTQPEVLAGL